MSAKSIRVPLTLQKSEECIECYNPFRFVVEVLSNERENKCGLCASFVSARDMPQIFSLKVVRIL